MTFFQNLFAQDFECNWLLGDRQHIPKFVCPRNSGRGDELAMVWKEGPYDLTGQDADGTIDRDLFDITFSLGDTKAWSTIQIDVGDGAASLSAVTPQEIVGNLNGNATFADRFSAFLTKFDSGNDRIVIKQLKPITQMKFYIENSGAEEALGFNDRAGVSELPTYFNRHTIANRYTFDDSQNHLVALDPDTSLVDAAIIDSAVDFNGVNRGYDSSSVQADWQLLKGKSGLFDFTSDDGSTSPNTKIVYSAGAKAGDLAKKIISDSTSYTFVIPYTLTNDDLITPP